MGIIVHHPPWPEEISVEPSRLSIGLWGETEGDIASAYCAHTFPKIRCFTHEAHLFTNTGRTCGFGKDSVDAYPLILEEDYKGPESKPYSYEGERVRYKGRNFRLGARVRFIARERSVAEWVDLMRRQYAYGGYFASGKTYAELLAEFGEEASISTNQRAAIDTEAARADLPQTQEEMLKQLEAKPAQWVHQLELAI